MTVDELHTKMEAGFKAIRTEVAAAVKAEGETTRQ
jgi:hypothetical protein